MAELVLFSNLSQGSTVRHQTKESQASDSYAGFLKRRGRKEGVEVKNYGRERGVWLKCTHYMFEISDIVYKSTWRMRRTGVAGLHCWHSAPF